ncbi:FecR domain-containing protein [Denitratisoma oestradiolicum]|uniref:Uncharacterized protein n=1 Tax=Denitratisoma oestradiolicum TaxID=311182 RepID=A0A6S6XNI1_9PROT|nr:FecR domain-containing protein [Denitratisoma oestradiolicum]CAB1367386.1 conserved exported protein of unknown function [Denitratisoma oestradiolicum]
MKLMCNLSLVVALLIVSNLALAEPDVGWVAQIKVARGIINVERTGQRHPGLVGMRLKQNDIITTAGNGSAGLMFLDNSMLSLGPDAEVSLQRFSYDPVTYMGAFDAFVKRGTVSVQSGNIARQSADAMRVTTPKAEIKGDARSYLVSVEK